MIIIQYSLHFIEDNPKKIIDFFISQAPKTSCFAPEYQRAIMLIQKNVVSLFTAFQSRIEWVQNVPSRYAGYRLGCMSDISPKAEFGDVAIVIVKGKREKMCSAKRAYILQKNPFNPSFVSEVLGIPERTKEIADAWNLESPIEIIRELERVFGFYLRIPDNIDEISELIGDYNVLQVYRCR